jgi:hypothetical protein
VALVYTVSPYSSLWPQEWVPDGAGVPQRSTPTLQIVKTRPAPSQSEQSDGKSDNNAEKARQRLIEKQEKQWLPGCAEYRRRIRATVRMAC